MGVFRSIANLVRTVATGGRTASMLMEDSGQAMKETKRRILIRLAWLFRKAIFYIGLCSVIVVLLVAAVALVFEIFSISFYGNDQAMIELNPEDMKVWAEGLSDDEIEQMQEHGASIHPGKIYEYALIEDESYPKNVIMQVPTHIRKWGDGGSSNETVYKDYAYKRGDTAYPYRQWWQSTATIDAINETADEEDNMDIVESAKEELKPMFTWSDPMTETYVEGSKYNETSQKEEEVIVTTTVKVVTRGEGETRTKTNHTEKRTLKPLPFLDMATTMFGNINFEYKEVQERPDPVVNRSTRTYTVTKKKKRINEETGEEEEYEVKERYTETTTVTTVTEVNTWEIVGESSDYQDTFINFLKSNKIDTKSDPYMMFLMAENMPQSYDFLDFYGEYLTYMNLYMDSYGYGGPTGSYTGDFGEFEGGSFTWPVPSNSRITSFYGYRTHPVTGARGSFHYGVDIAAAMGVDIVSVADGTVSFVGPKGTYGNVVMVNHGSGIETLYAHNSRLVVAPGEKVSKGDVIAKAGSTGRSTGPHLHFEIRKNGKQVEPLAWLRR